MKLILILSSLIIVQAGVIKEEDDEACDGILMNGTYHEAEVLKADLDRPYLLAMDYSTNTLYFSYNEDKEIFKSARLDLDTKEFKNIEDVPNGFAQSVDPKTHDVYIGGSDGLYKYNKKLDKSEFIGERGTDIWTLFFKDVLYFSIFPSQFLYTFSNGETNRFEDLQDTKIDQFIIDDKDYMFYTNATGIYGQKLGTDEATLYKELPYNGVRGMTTDVHGRVHVCFQDGIYAVNKDFDSLDKVVELVDAFGVAFDRDNNLIYADATKLVRLKPNKDKTC